MSVPASPSTSLNSCDAFVGCSDRLHGELGALLPLRWHISVSKWANSIQQLKNFSIIAPSDAFFALNMCAVQLNIQYLNTCLRSFGIMPSENCAYHDCNYEVAAFPDPRV